MAAHISSGRGFVHTTIVGENCSDKDCIDRNGEKCLQKIKTYILNSQFFSHQVSQILHPFYYLESRSGGLKTEEVPKKLSALYLVLSPICQKYVLFLFQSLQGQSAKGPAQTLESDVHTSLSKGDFKYDSFKSAFCALEADIERYREDSKTQENKMALHIKGLRRRFAKGIAASSATCKPYDLSWLDSSDKLFEICAGGSHVFICALIQMGKKRGKFKVPPWLLEAKHLFSERKKVSYLQSGYSSFEIEVPRFASAFYAYFDNRLGGDEDITDIRKAITYLIENELKLSDEEIKSLKETLSLALLMQETVTTGWINPFLPSTIEGKFRSVAFPRVTLINERYPEKIKRFFINIDAIFNRIKTAKFEVGVFGSFFPMLTNDILATLHGDVFSDFSLEGSPKKALFRITDSFLSGSIATFDVFLKGLDTYLEDELLSSVKIRAALQKKSAAGKSSLSYNELCRNLVESEANAVSSIKYTMKELDKLQDPYNTALRLSQAEYNRERLSEAFNLCNRLVMQVNGLQLIYKKIALLHDCEEFVSYSKEINIESHIELALLVPPRKSDLDFYRDILKEGSPPLGVRGFAERSLEYYHYIGIVEILEGFKKTVSLFVEGSAGLLLHCDQMDKKTSISRVVKEGRAKSQPFRMKPKIAEGRAAIPESFLGGIGRGCGGGGGGGGSGVGACRESLPEDMDDSMAVSKKPLLLEESTVELSSGKSGVSGYAKGELFTFLTRLEQAMLGKVLAKRDDSGSVSRLNTAFSQLRLFIHQYYVMQSEVVEKKLSSQGLADLVSSSHLALEQLLSSIYLSKGGDPKSLVHDLRGLLNLIGEYGLFTKDILIALDNCNQADISSRNFAKIMDEAHAKDLSCVEAFMKLAYQEKSLKEEDLNNLLFSTVLGFFSIIKEMHPKLSSYEERVDAIFAEEKEVVTRKPVIEVAGMPEKMAAVSALQGQLEVLSGPSEVTNCKMFLKRVNYILSSVDIADPFDIQRLEIAGSRIMHFACEELIGLFEDKTKGFSNLSHNLFERLVLLSINLDGFSEEEKAFLKNNKTHNEVRYDTSDIKKEAKKKSSSKTKKASKTRHGVKGKDGFTKVVGKVEGKGYEFAMRNLQKGLSCFEKLLSLVEKEQKSKASKASELGRGERKDEG